MRVRGVHHCGQHRRRHDPGTRAADATNDSNWTYQSATTSGNVLANDTDPAGGGLTVSPVNGCAANLGTTIQLASGALLTVNANGGYDYNPNGAFDYLADTGLNASDGFTYTMTDSLGNQSWATVSIIIDGDSWGSWYPPTRPSNGWSSW
jgi:hypothetical protein